MVRLPLSSGNSSPGWPVRNHSCFIFGSIGIVVFSLLGKAPSASMQKRFAEADAHYHTAPPTKLQAEQLPLTQPSPRWGEGIVLSPM
ncbi:hypothetical protein ACVXG7_02010 [Enterobacter hormaechei]